MADDGCGGCNDTSLITIPVGPAGANGTNGTNGTNGIDGDPGIFGGFSAKWKFDATTSGTAAATYLKFDSTLLSSVSVIQINNDNFNNVDHTNFLLTFVNTINSINQFGLIRIFKETDSNVFWLGTIDDYANGGTTKDFAVTHILSNGSFNGDDAIVVSFTPNGENAASDKEIIHADYTITEETGTSPVILSTYTAPANLLATNGSQLEIQVSLKRTDLVPSAVFAKIAVAGDYITYSDQAWLLNRSIDNVVVKFTMTRINSTTVFVNMQSHFITTLGTITPSWAFASNVAWNSAVGTNTITLHGYTADGLGNKIGTQEFVIKKFDK